MVKSGSAYEGGPSGLKLDALPCLRPTLHLSLVFLSTRQPRLPNKSNQMHIPCRPGIDAGVPESGFLFESRESSLPFNRELITEGVASAYSPALRVIPPSASIWRRTRFLWETSAPQRTASTNMVHSLRLRFDHGFNRITRRPCPTFLAPPLLVILCIE